MGQKSKQRLSITKREHTRPLPRGEAPWEQTVNRKNDANQITLGQLILLSLVMQTCSL